MTGASLDVEQNGKNRKLRNVYRKNNKEKKRKSLSNKVFSSYFKIFILKEKRNTNERK